MRREISLRFPLELPGVTIDKVTIDLERPGMFVGQVDPEQGLIARIVGLPVAVLHELVESDYVRILLAIEELNAPRLALKEVE